MACIFREELQRETDDSNTSQEAQRAKNNQFELNLRAVRQLDTGEDCSYDGCRNAEE